MQWRVPLSDLDYGDAEDQAVLDVLHSKWLTMGSVTQQFEAAFAKLTGAKHAISVSNATQALHLACLACDVGPGDEVIVPSLSFVATSNVVLYCGAEVRFADIISPQDLTIDPASIAAAITPRTKAIIPMHYAGYPSQMEAIMSLAREHGLAVIEDAAHAPGAYLDGRHLGTIGDIGCFSFFSNKNLPVGEGGMLTTDRDDLAAKLSLTRSHGMTSLTYDRHKGHAFSYDVVALGYNYRIDEIRSALGLQQLRKLAANNAKRREFTLDYWAALAETGLTLPFKEANYGQPSHHIMPVLLPEGTDRNALMTSLRDAGIQSSIHYRPIHTFTYYVERYGVQHLTVTEAAAAREVTLPLYPTMGLEGVKLVTDTIKAILN